MHVAGLLALWPLQAMSDAVCLFHHTGVHWVLNHTLHTAILHASVAGGRAFAVDTSFIDVGERLPWVRSNSNRSSRVNRISVIIQAEKLSMYQYLEEINIVFSFKSGENRLLKDIRATTAIKVPFRKEFYAQLLNVSLDQ